MDVSLVKLIYFVFTSMLGDSYRKRFRSFSVVVCLMWRMPNAIPFIDFNAVWAVPVNCSWHGTTVQGTHTQRYDLESPRQPVRQVADKAPGWLVDRKVSLLKLFFIDAVLTCPFCASNEAFNTTADLNAEPM